MSENNNLPEDNISKEEFETTSKLLNNIYSKNTNDNIKIGVLLQSIDTGGFALLVLILAIILFLPTPPPSSQICAVMIMFLSLQMIIGLPAVWLPRFITEISIKRKTLAFIVEKSNIFLYRVERFTRRRFTFMNSSIVERIVGVVLFVLSVISLIPIPFISAIPGIAMIMVSFGLLNKDGGITIVGLIIGLIGMMTAWSAVVLGKAILLRLLSMFF